MSKSRFNWRYWSKQKKAEQLAGSGRFDITVFQGGYRSGKSVTGSRFILKQALRVDDSKWLAMAVNYNIGKQTTYNVLFDMALPGEDLNPFEGGDPERSPVVSHWTKIDKTLTLRNGSTIVLAGADTSDRYEGGSFNGAWIDEPGNYGDKLFGVTSTLLERLDRGEPGSMLWTTTGKTGALQTFLQDREWGNGDPVRNSVEVVRASTENNPFLSSDALDRLRRRYEGGANEEMALHGEFGDVEGRVYPRFKRENHVLPRKVLEDRLNENKRFKYSYDAGWDDERVVLQAGILRDGSIAVLDEFYESGLFTEDAVNWTKGRSRGLIFCEHEPEHIEKFNRLTRHKAVKAKKSISAGIDAVRNRLAKNGVYVAEECGNTVDELLGYQKDDIGGSNVSDHACDCLRYLVMGVEGRGSGSGDVEVGSVSAV